MKLYSIWKGGLLIFLIGFFFSAFPSPVQGQDANSSAKRSSPVEKHATPKEAKKPVSMDIVLVLDNSGSMKQNDPDFLIKEVVNTFFRNWYERAHIGLVVFDQQAKLVLPLSALNEETGKMKLSEVLSTMNYKGQKTNIAAGVERAIYEIKVHGRPGAKKACILLTDGRMDTGNMERNIERERWLRKDLAEEAREKGIRIYGIAFTENADYTLLQAIAMKTKGDYFRAIKASELQKVFQELQASILREEPPPVSPPKKVPKPRVPPPIQNPVNPPVQVPVKRDYGLGINTILLGIIALAVIGFAVLFFLKRDSQKTIVQQLVRSSSDDKEDVPEVNLIYLGKALNIMPEEDQNIPDPFEPNSSKVFKLQEIRMGRNTKNTFVIPDSENVVSGAHAKIIYKRGEFFLIDLKSTNGTFLNGQRLEMGQEYLLKSGEEFSLYIYRFRFVVVGDQQERDTVLESDMTVVKPVSSGGADPSQSREGSDGQEGDRAKKPEDSPDPEAPSPQSQRPGGSADSTIPFLRMCSIHPSRQAEHICVVCKNVFCDECVTIENGRAICHECKDKHA